MNTSNRMSVTFLTIILSSFVALSGAHSEETKTEKAQAASDKAVDSVKSTYRDAQDKTCELVNGKMECVYKKMVNKSKTAAEKSATKAKELKNKAD
jgi:hypothetical protein